MFYNPYVVSFFGHRYISSQTRHKLEKELDKLIIDIINQKDEVEFIVGYAGDFNTLAASAVKRMKNFSCEDNSELTLVLPYENKTVNDNINSFMDFYDWVYVCEESDEAHPKKAYEICNKYMIDKSDLAVFFIDQPSGGAYKAYKYVQSQPVKTINLGSLDKTAQMK